MATMRSWRSPKALLIAKMIAMIHVMPIAVDTVRIPTTSLNEIIIDLYIVDGDRR
tara:strand:- start:288 stop:452 length:165 start_codon:yes stop_codon:yes gene_type:complete